MFSLSSILRCQIGKPIATRHRHLSLVSTASLADVSTGTVYSVLRIFTFVKIDIPAAIMFNRIISLLALSVSPWRDTGVVLLGDACHAFPPDAGQGVNAGFQDIIALDRALRGQDIISGRAAVKPVKKLLLGDALEAYERNRGPEHKALIQLALSFAPYQYRQSWRRDRAGAMLWAINAQIRMLLNKFTFGLFPPPVFIICQNHNMTFRQVMRRANLGTLCLQLISCFALLMIISKRFVPAWTWSALGLMVIRD